MEYFFSAYRQLAVILVHPNDMHFFINARNFIYQAYGGKPTVQ
jgi:hypothetical protein